MIIVMTGGTGLVGQALSQKLSSQNYKVHLLSRKINNNSPYKTFLWPDTTLKPPREAFPGEEEYGIIHLAGEPVFQWPWTKKIKQNIYSSRVEGAKQLFQIIKELPRPPEFFLSANATGIYGEGGETEFTETNPITDQNLFLQKVCKDWEKEVLQMSSLCRTLVFRFGTVLSEKKGFLYEQIKWIKRGAFPMIMSQKNFWLSWIAIEDLTSMILWAIQNKNSRGIYNAVSPKPISLQHFYTSLLKEKNFKGVKIPSPLSLVKLFGGEMMKNILMSHKVLPEKALAETFMFQTKSMIEVLKNNV